MRHAKSEKPKKSFIKRWFPCRGDRPSTVVLKILTLVCLLVFFVSAWMLLDEMVLKPAEVDQSVNSLKDQFFTPVSSSESNSESDPEESKKEEEEEPIDYAAQLAALQKTYPDIVGWIQIPGTVIDYPILQSDESDPEYYLYRNYEKQYSKYGSIFASSDSVPFPECRNNLLYGHSMQDGRMFAALVQFSDLSVYQNSPTITLYTAEGKSTWKIYAVMKLNTLESQGEFFPFTQTSFADDDAFMQHVYEIYQRSVIDTGVTINEGDEILSLATCSYEYENFRTVVVARKVRDGEEASVDPSSASYNNRVVYPDIWYEGKDSSAPVWTENWQDAVLDGSFAAYDGAIAGE